MQLPILASLIFLALRSASAQTLAGVPPCAQAAALAGIQTTGCKSTEIECICKATAFLTALKSALSSICSEADQQTTIAFAISLCDSVGQSIAVPSSQAAEALPSEIPIPTDTSTPIETAILIYADGASSAVVDEPSTTAPTEAGSISSPVYYDTTTYISDSASLTVSTYLTSSTPAIAAATSPSKNNTGNNSTVTAKKPIPFQGRAASLGGAGWIAPCAALAGAAGLALWL